MRINVKILSLLIAILVLAAFTAKSQPTGVDPSIRDSVIISSATTYSTNSGSVPVYFYNDESLAGIEITLAYNSPDIMIDSFSFVGSRLEPYSLKGADQLTTNTVTVYSYALDEGLMSSGSGLLGTVYFSFIPNITTPQTIVVDTATLLVSDREFSTAFSDENSNAFSPYILSGGITILSGSCCLGDRGNVDNSPDDIVDISDIVYLVNFMFNLGPTPACPFEGNVDGSADEITDISDLVFLVQYSFNSGPPPPSCP
ncbi:MAG: hypothetical protein DWP97_00695 [Calditrichaeota bacterium]|nr:MAG: hypothetical protein DWP97_00695 [Calditrichota bacterium]